MDYISKIVNEVLARRRERVERRNDFIQMMVDREEEAKDEQKATEQGAILTRSTLSELDDQCRSTF